MLDILLVVHIVISSLLIVVILLQKNGGDGLAGLGGGGGGNMGLVNARSAANFFTRVTVFLAILFMSNSLLLANLSNNARQSSHVVEKLKEPSKAEHENKHTLPMAK